MIDYQELGDLLEREKDLLERDKELLRQVAERAGATEQPATLILIAERVDLAARRLRYLVATLDEMRTAREDNGDLAEKHLFAIAVARVRAKAALNLGSFTGEHDPVSEHEVLAARDYLDIEWTYNGQPIA